MQNIFIKFQVKIIQILVSLPKFFLKIHPETNGCKVLLNKLIWLLPKCIVEKFSDQPNRFQVLEKNFFKMVQVKSTVII